MVHAHLPVKFTHKIARVPRGAILYLRSLECVKVVWTDDEVELLLTVTIDYKVTKTSENVPGSHVKPSTPKFCICLLRCIYLQKK